MGQGGTNPAHSERGRMKKRILVLLSVVALMVVMLAMSVAPAFALGPPSLERQSFTCRTIGGAQDDHEQARIPLFCQA